MSSSTQVSPVVNIGPRQRKLRKTMGIAALLTGFIVAGALTVLQVDRVWRLALFLPFWAGCSGIFQARAKT